MHAFPPAEALRFLVGLKIGQVALDPWSLQFRFDDGGGITVEGKIEHIDESGAVHTYDCQDRRSNPLYLHQLLQQPICALDVEPLCLSLAFASSAKLRIFTELNTYECGQIYPPAGAAKGFFVF
jgi:hypothetical protein